MVEQKVFKSILWLFLLINNVYSIGLNYDIKIKGIEPMTDFKDPFCDLKDVKMKKLNKTHYTIDGIYTILREDIPSDDLLMSIHIALKKGNGYIESSLVQLHKRKYCDMWDNEQFLMPDVKRHIQCISNSKNSTELLCPPLVGTYKLANYVPQYKVPANMPEGRWRFIFEYYKNDELIGGYKAYADFKREIMADDIF
ncbi:uncharacterized protein LOC123290930 [Chrysoperla carnea]|uniref:uncharacterized protein LOC123290930 n=1 Tax=Chrysoperla carnea TaxID=189513 RepID=UPI001D06EADB|nr:uncharacterized protein LOC123290930 [Chrysoperla carnea]